jgi:hypothetical protein
MSRFWEGAISVIGLLIKVRTVYTELNQNTILSVQIALNPTIPDFLNINLATSEIILVQADSNRQFYHHDFPWIAFWK